jgi:hypothetical protein
MVRRTTGSGVFRGISGNLTRKQAEFLRDYMASAGGDEDLFYPSPGIFRRWMAGETFRQAIRRAELLQGIQSDMHLASAATAASALVHELIASATSDSARRGHLNTLQDLLEVMRMGRGVILSQEPAQATPPAQAHEPSDA